MEIIAVTVCVNFHDILKHIVYQNSKFFKKWLIVTSQEDTNTIDLINEVNKENIQILIYSYFYKNAKFNKGGSLFFAQEYIDKNYKKANILFLDCDIYLPDDFMDRLPSSLEDDTLYGVSRTDFWTLEDFVNNKNPHPKKNPHFLGFFQLYKQNSYKYKDSYNCSGCDCVFRNNFRNKKKKLDIHVKHLGRNGPNWNGRDFNFGIF